MNTNSQIYLTFALPGTKVTIFIFFLIKEKASYQIHILSVLMFDLRNLTVIRIIMMLITGLTFVKVTSSSRWLLSFKSTFKIKIKENKNLLKVNL